MAESHDPRALARRAGDRDPLPWDDRGVLGHRVIAFDSRGVARRLAPGLSLASCRRLRKSCRAVTGCTCAGEPHYYARPSSCAVFTGILSHVTRHTLASQMIAWRFLCVLRELGSPTGRATDGTTEEFYAAVRTVSPAIRLRARRAHERSVVPCIAGLCRRPLTG